MVELGADMIKAFFTSNFSDIVSNTPVPVFSIGAEKLKNDLDVLKKAYNTTRAGARGIIFGRNIFMAENPENLISALNDVMNNNIKPDAAFKKNNL